MRQFLPLGELGGPCHLTDMECSLFELGSSTQYLSSIPWPRVQSVAHANTAATLLLPGLNGGSAVCTPC